MKSNKEITSKFQTSNEVNLQAVLLCLGYCRKYQETADVKIPNDIKLFILKFFTDKIAQEPQEAPQQSRVAGKFDNQSSTPTSSSRIETSMSDSSMSLFSPSSCYALDITSYASQNNISRYNVAMSFLHFYGPSYPKYKDIQDNSDISSANAECADDYVHHNINFI